jgi:hypothetical protein
VLSHIYCQIAHCIGRAYAESDVESEMPCPYGIIPKSRSVAVLKFTGRAFVTCSLGGSHLKNHDAVIFILRGDEALAFNLPVGKSDFSVKD